MYQKPKNTPFKVDYYAYQILDRKNKKPIWTRIGIATRAKSGEDVINIKLNAFPVDGRLTLLIPSEPEAEETPEVEA
ncbi:hypothetical protein [Singulisphaera sp. PoT]|uniref:hypothetical protein n=1 Tax=Singulisphaera sp. PoT TaxID=3411797 RepID=UPI003BF5C9AD